MIVTVEIGYGTTTVVANTDEGKFIRTFPSIPVPVKRNASIGEGVLERRAVVEVPVNGVYYEVGEDVAKVQAARSSRVLNTDVYITSDRYMALLKGGLKMLPTNKIDVLVLGLPVSVMSRKDELIKIVQGEHDLGDRKVNVNRVLVFEQPLGALLSYIREGGNERFKEVHDQSILAIDIGYLTCDFLVTKGLKPNRNRSDDCDLGMSRVLDAVATTLKDVLIKSPTFAKMKDINVELIDEGFMTGKLKLYGQEMSFPANVNNDLPTFDMTSSINTVTNSAVSKIIDKVGDGQDIDLIIVAGGSAHIYMPAIKSAFPAHKVILLGNSVTAVATGLQTAGEQFSKAALARGDWR
jgi:plasmid segregation protein ParM